MSVRSKFTAYTQGSHAPRVHPVIQLMLIEWRDAENEHRQPRWNVLTKGAISKACEQVAHANTTWHADLYATDLSKYNKGLASKSMWWVLPGTKSPARKKTVNGA